MRVMTTSMVRSLLILVAASAAATGLWAQAPAAPKLEFPSASPPATIKQRVGITDIEVNYSRPSMRGRKIFGGLEPYGAVWRAGANQATKITFSTPVRFGGVDVEAGSYALFAVPGEQEWQVILNKVPGQWGAYRYDAANDAAKVRVKPMRLDRPVETFAIGFSDIRQDSANLYLAWENVRVPVEIYHDVKADLLPRIQAAMAGEGKKPYFEAAMFYYENNIDLAQAAKWIDEAIAANPNAFWAIYRKGLILAKMGDKEGARAAANKSLEMANQQQGGIKDEYIRLNNALLAGLK
jgi:tetratricopeptide (TPR) repeat protein